MTNKKQAQGHWLGVGIAIGAACGIVVGLIMSKLSNTPGMLPIGLASCISGGFILGIVFEEKYNAKAKPLTDVRHRLLLAIVFFTGILILASMLALFFIAYSK